MPESQLTKVGSDGRAGLALTPFFSIGVTTYDRRELLKQTLVSIINQTFSDFEVIVGNDYVQEPLSAEFLGIEDPRIRFVNHPQNLGEVGNMNSLLGMSHGKYFTWLADDDLYAPDFLQMLHVTLVKFDLPPCAFTSYRHIRGTSSPDVAQKFSGLAQLFSGRRFLRMYLGGKLKVIGTYGVFDTESLRQMGGVERLCEAPMVPLAEYMLLVRCGLLENIAYIDAPLVLYRAHETSWFRMNPDVDFYKQAGQNLVRESVEVFSRPELRDDFHRNLSSLLRLPVKGLVRTLAARDGYLDGREVMAYLFSMKEQFNSLKGSILYWMALANLGQAGVRLVWRVARSKFKSAAPAGLLKLARKVRSFFPRHERKAFWD